MNSNKNKAKNSSSVFCRHKKILHWYLPFPELLNSTPSATEKSAACSSEEPYAKFTQYLEDKTNTEKTFLNLQI